MILNDAGKMILKQIHELPQKFAHIRCDIFISMPNHGHVIVIISPAGADQRVM